MRISHFFIDRPIFAAVVSIVFVILGSVSFARLPVAQYPDIAPPTINVTGQYPGASADVVASTVVSPIEDQINGVENMIYMSSNSTSDGRFTIAVSFELGTNLDIAQVQVQNRVAIAQPRLPADVRNIGVTVTKASPDLMMVVHIYSPDQSRDGLFISNYATLEIKDALTRVDGVGSITVFGVPRFLDAHLARSRPPAVPQHDCGRCHAGAAGPERPGRLRRAQPAADESRRPLRGRGADARPARRTRRILRDRGEAHARRAGAPQGRGAGRTRGPGLHHEFLSRSRSRGGARHLPAAGIERAGDGEGRHRHHERWWRSDFRRASNTPSSTTRPSSSSSRSMPSSRPSARPSSWWCWS